LLVLGDSLSAAYGIPRESGGVSLLQQKLPNVHVVNAGISGDTTDGGLARLPALLRKHQPEVVIIELGGNDGLRGFQTPRRLGNSLSAAYGIRRARGWVSLLQQKLPNVHVVNAGNSGDTTDGGLARLPAQLRKHQPEVVIIELGGNVGLRGFQTPRIRDNIEQMIRLCQGANAKILLLGMKIPPN